ncbi:hypothetical protein BT63DRAFT_454934 [Microthyrium microscopicum]|uniref:Integral membrane protein n=1 Tax=Microthyrium microscopicum TaxID=703497 RepID=A0A6A6UDH0_9PEZI|nr:hypothetical protein BT63DRAFT_454934 [Microthyrium microscopicum]
MASSSPSRLLSHSPFLRVIAASFGAVPLGYGINAFLRPMSAMNIFFLFPSATDPLLEPTMYLYAIRAIYMGLTVMIAAYYGHRKTMGAILIALSGISLVDGAVVRTYGGENSLGEKGAENIGHWIWGPPCALVGALLMGIADRQVG